MQTNINRLIQVLDTRKAQYFSQDLSGLEREISNFIKTSLKKNPFENLSGLRFLIELATKFENDYTAALEGIGLTQVFPIDHNCHFFQLELLRFLYRKGIYGYLAPACMRSRFPSLDEKYKYNHLILVVPIKHGYCFYDPLIWGTTPLRINQDKSPINQVKNRYFSYTWHNNLIVRTQSGNHTPTRKILFDPEIELLQSWKLDLISLIAVDRLRVLKINSRGEVSIGLVWDLTDDSFYLLEGGTLQIQGPIDEIVNKKDFLTDLCQLIGAQANVIRKQLFTIRQHILTWKQQVWLLKSI